MTNVYVFYWIVYIEWDTRHITRPWIGELLSERDKQTDYQNDYFNLLHLFAVEFDDIMINLY